MMTLSISYILVMRERKAFMTAEKEKQVDQR